MTHGFCDRRCRNYNPGRHRSLPKQPSKSPLLAWVHASVLAARVVAEGHARRAAPRLAKREREGRIAGVEEVVGKRAAGGPRRARHSRSTSSSYGPMRGGSFSSRGPLPARVMKLPK